MMYVDGNNLKITEDPQIIVVESCLQEMRLWIGENDLDIERGVDYKSVFEQTVFLKTELQRVADNHSENFKSIEIGEPEMDKDEIIRISVIFYLKDNTISSRELLLDLQE